MGASIIESSNIFYWRAQKKPLGHKIQRSYEHKYFLYTEMSPSMLPGKHCTRPPSAGCPPT